MSDLPPLDALESMRAFELKAALQAVNLDTEGPRSDLLARLRTYILSGNSGSEGGKAVQIASPKGKRPLDSASPTRQAAPEAASAPLAPAKLGDSESSDDDFGPSAPVTKKKRVLAHESVLLDALPSSSLYEKSYMHRDRVSHTLVCPNTDFIVTASVDGHLKFWKKMKLGVEFVKHYKAHLGAIIGVDVSADGRRLCTIGDDFALKLYDVANFDMVYMLKLSYKPSCCAWVYPPGSPRPLLAVAEASHPLIHVYNVDTFGASEDGAVVSTLTFHRAPVLAMCYIPSKNCVVSGDDMGVLEYWKADDFGFPASFVTFKLKSDTDLYELAKRRTKPTSISAAANGTRFAVTAKDCHVRVFAFDTGKLKREYDESLGVFEAAQRAGTLKMEAIDFGRRMAGEKELLGTPGMPPSNAVFDFSGHFLLYPTLCGIKVVNLETNRVARVLGSGDANERFLAISLYQGTPKVSSQIKTGGKTGGAPISGESAPGPDPTVIAASFKRARFYLLSTRLPCDDDPEGRDVLNEAPSKDEAAMGAGGDRQRFLAKQVVLHTNYGDITIKLFGDECPKTVENFSTHCRNGYYDGIVFHRVIKDFMVQTGDPRGDGTGGESIWGGEFEDEIHRDLRHDRAFTVSMANAGPNTNGSQFFITTQPTPWLDNKHTVFGRVVNGMDTVRRIETVKVNKSDKPLEEIRIVNTDVS